jgi:hypothetical protein
MTVDHGDPYRTELAGLDGVGAVLWVRIDSNR